MSAGLADDDTVEDNDIGDLDLDKISVNPPVQREKKKTKIQRNKEKKLKQQVHISNKCYTLLYTLLSISFINGHKQTAINEFMIVQYKLVIV